MMTKEEIKVLKELFAEDTEGFFKEMEKRLEDEPEMEEELLKRKNKLKKIKKEFKDEFITREQYNVDEAKIEKAVFELIDKLAEIQGENSVNSDKSFQNTYHDQTYTLLCYLDFKKQVEYFEAMVESKKPVIPFVVRASENHGQRWLYNRLIHHYQEKKVIHNTLLIDFKELHIANLDNLMDYLSERMSVQKYNPSDTFDKKKIKLRNTISNLIDTASQFIVFKNAYTFIHSPDFDRFYELLAHFYTELDAIEPEHKCIFLFVEQSLEPYAHSDYCIFSSETQSFKAKIDKTLKIIDLDAIKNITRNCMEDWFGRVPEEIIDFFDSSDEGLELLIKECGNGNPEIIIPAICEKIGINFHEHKSTWLKY